MGSPHLMGAVLMAKEELAEWQAGVRAPSGVLARLLLLHQTPLFDDPLRDTSDDPSACMKTRLLF